MNAQLIPDTKECFASHMGLWAIEKNWFAATVKAVKDGIMPMAKVETVRDGDGTPLFTDVDGIAIIQMSGPMMKGVSKFGGVSTLRTRRAVRLAASDDQIRGILLHVDSPGGHVAGTDDLSMDISAAAKEKLLFAHIDDMGASSAIWAIAGATQISANQSASVGSIGVFTFVVDSSEMAEREGIKVHVISTGEFKGAFVPGAEITEAQLQELQHEVDAINKLFLKAVSDGRDLPLKAVTALADGRMHIAKEAKKIGLIDKVATFDEVFEQLMLKVTPKRSKSMARNRLALAKLQKNF